MSNSFAIVIKEKEKSWPVCRGTPQNGFVTASVDFLCCFESSFHQMSVLEKLLSIRISTTQDF